MQTDVNLRQEAVGTDFYHFPRLIEPDDGIKNMAKHF